jgi:hypothetical protein
MSSETKFAGAAAAGLGNGRPALAGIDTPYRVTLPDPKGQPWFGPATKRRLIRTTAIYAVVFAVGIVLMATSHGRLGALGLGLYAPGTGFLYPVGWLGPILFVLTVGLFAFSVLLWYGAGAIVAPAGVWIVGAIVAALITSPHDDGHMWAQVAVPAICALFVTRQWVRSYGRYRRAQDRGVQLNEVLAGPGMPAQPRFGGGEPPRMPEFSAEDLAHQRFVLDLGLQPLDSFEGFSLTEQWQLGAVRYQLGDVQSAIAIGQYTHTPAFHGYVSEAQRNLIDKYTQPIVWRYWFYENLMGNLRWDPDPMTRDNIMLSGYMDRYIGYYTAATDDRRYGELGAFTFTWNDDTEYLYDHHSINDAVVHEYKRYDFGLFPCEPNFVFPICNVRGMAGVKLHDTIYGTKHFLELYDSFRHGLETEFSEPDGAMHFIRTTRFGFNLWKHWPENVQRGGLATYLNGIYPDIAEREYQLFLHSWGDKRLEIPFKLSGRRWEYPGLNGGAVIARTEGAGAREMGDDELADKFIEAAGYLKPEVVDGVLVYPFRAGVSARASAQLYENRAGRAGAHYDLLNQGLPETWATGPVLADAPYPHVLVASAYTDGKALDLVLRPSVEKGRHALGVARLVPERPYAVTGAVEPQVVADARGNATITVDLDDRLEVAVKPA